MRKVVFCTLRDNKGATGGPGGVLYIQKEVLGRSINNIQCEYWFNFFCGGGFCKRLFNKIFFFARCFFTREAYFFTHELTSGWILSILRKKYSMIYHNQGPALEERIVKNGEVNKLAAWFLQYRERKAFTNAATLHFPSVGAEEMYFKSLYASCSRNEVNVQAPLYNIILPIDIHKPSEFNLRKENDVLTFFSVGTLTMAKGQDQSIKFLSEFLNYYKEKVRYIIVGKGPLKNQLIMQLDNLKIQNKNFDYCFFDALPHDIVMYLHQISDVYIMLHRVSIFDFATLEAMSQSSVVILSKVGGNPEFNYDNNIIFAEDALANMSDFVQQDFSEYKKKNKKVFDQYFSRDAYKKQYEMFVTKYVK